MKRHILIYVLAALLPISLVGCFGDSEQEEMERAQEEMERAQEEMERAQEEMERAQEELQRTGEETGEDLGEGMEALGRAMERMGEALSEGAGVEPVNFRELRDRIPERVAGMEEVDRGGKTGGNPIVKMSTAFAEFRDGDERIKIEVVDLGNLKGAAMLGYGWLMAEIDEETRTRVRRSFKYDGHPAFLEFNRDDADTDIGDGEVHVAVFERFIVGVEGRNVTQKRLMEVVDDFDFDDLEDLKDEGVEKE